MTLFWSQFNEVFPLRRQLKNSSLFVIDFQSKRLDVFLNRKTLQMKSRLISDKYLAKS